MRGHHFFIVILLAAIVSVSASYGLRGTVSATVQRESSFERIKRDGVIRCGYVVATPFLLKDPNTGALSGLAYDFMQAIAREFAVRVDWAEEAGWGDFHEGLNGGRYDMMCVPVWQSGARAKQALLTRPLYYSEMLAFARADDDRFDHGFDAVNRKDVRVAVIDGDISQSVRRMRFPDAQELALPQISDNAQYIMNVVNRKADVSFQNIEGIEAYNKNATDKIKVIAGGAPARLFANSLAVRLGDADLKNGLDAAIEALINDGTATGIIKTYPAFRTPLSGMATDRVK